MKDERSDIEYMQDLAGMNLFEKWLMDELDRLDDVIFGSRADDVKEEIIQRDTIKRIRNAYYKLINSK